MFRGYRGGRGLTEGRRGVAAERDWSLRLATAQGGRLGGHGSGWARLGLGSLGELPAAVTRWLRLVNGTDNTRYLGQSGRAGPDRVPAGEAWVCGYLQPGARFGTSRPGCVTSETTVASGTSRSRRAAVDVPLPTSWGRQRDIHSHDHPRASRARAQLSLGTLVSRGGRGRCGGGRSLPAVGAGGGRSLPRRERRQRPRWAPGAAPAAPASPGPAVTLRGRPET